MRKGFVFDLDGVITDTADDHFAAWKELASQLGIDIDVKFNEQLKGIGRMDSLERILVYGGKQNDFTAEQKKALAARKNKAYRKMLKKLSSKDLLPGALKFLKEAKRKNVMCSLASGSRNAPYIIEKLGVEEYFDGIVNPAAIKNSKPDPEIYIRGAEIIGLSPRVCVGFEDAQAGIESIKNAGMLAVGIEGNEHLKGADINVRSLDELSIDELLRR